MASPDWLANVRSSSGVSASKPPLELIPDHECPDQPVAADQGHGEQ